MANENLSISKPEKGFSVKIRNKDEVCCACVIIVVKAKYDKGPQFKSIVSRTGTLQGRLAHDLHNTAGGVALGSCGIKEIT